MALRWGSLSLILSLLIVQSTNADTNPPVYNYLSNETIAELKQAKDVAWSYAIKCDGGVAMHNCSDGDSTLWNGLMCATGNEDWACNAVMRSQGQDGRIWRSPRRVGLDKSNSFSRDMGEGVLCFLGTTKNVTFANKWTDYVNEIGFLCPDETGNACACHRKCSTNQDRCWVVPSFWCNYAFVGYKVGFRHFHSKIVDVAECPLEDLFLWYAAKHNEPGYTLHLVGVNLLARAVIGGWNDVLQNAAKDLNHRQPLNPFFEWLHTGATETLARRFLTTLFQKSPSQRLDWAWQRADVEQRWKVGCGFDFIFLIDLLLYWPGGPQYPQQEASLEYHNLVD